MAVLIIAGVLIIFSACSGSNRSSNRPQTNMSNSEVQQAIRSKFNSDPQLSATDIKIDADANNNQIKLSGNVKSQEIRNKAINAAKSVVPNFMVTDTIDVRPDRMARASTEDQKADQVRQVAKSRGDSVGDSVEDSHIHAQVLDKLVKANVPFQQIGIDVEKGVVTLRGNIKNGEEKARIQQTVQQVKGVKRINNKLELGG
jgi:osmotically-inducible protein OsmY